MTEFFSIRDVGKLRAFSDVDPIEVSISSVLTKYAHFTLVRFCHFENEELCPTAFFMNGVGDENFHGMGFFPAKATWSDRLEGFCGSCGEIRVLLFDGPGDSGKAVGFSPAGILF